MPIGHATNIDWDVEYDYFLGLVLGLTGGIIACQAVCYKYRLGRRRLRANRARYQYRLGSLLRLQPYICFCRAVVACHPGMQKEV